jgi:predicted helicase
MKTTYWLSILMAAGMFTLAACSKPKPPQFVIEFSQDVDKINQVLPKFEEVFSGSSPNEAVKKISQSIHYQHYDDALNHLESLAETTALNETQKQAVADLTDAVQRLVAKMAASKKPAPEEEALSS